MSHDDASSPSFVLQKRRKLSISSIERQYDELESLKKSFDLMYFSKGEIYMHSKYLSLQTRLEQSTARQFQLIDDSNELICGENTKSKLTAGLRAQKAAILDTVQHEKKKLTLNLNRTKERFDAAFNELSSQVDEARHDLEHSEHMFELRKSLNDLKHEIKDTLKHFSDLIEFPLDVRFG